MIRFIAEVSSNHHVDLERCKEFIRAAAAAECQAVKFQLFKIDKLFAREILDQSEQHRKRKDWELPLEFVPALAAECKINNIQFSCTPFYLEAVAELEPFVDFYKIASYELLWDDLLEACARTGKEVILSTGMATISEIKHAVDVLRDNFCTLITLLHCTSAYPTPYEEANLAAIKTIADETGCAVGWSDHTVKPAVIYRSIHRWRAETIEFHLDLDGEGEEFNSGHCWLPAQIAEVITTVNQGIAADGSGVKEPVKSEFPDRDWRADPSDGLRPLKKIRKIFKSTS